MNRYLNGDFRGAVFNELQQARLSILLLLTTSGTALLGVAFVIIVWAVLFAERSTGQGWTLLPLWTFTGAILMDALPLLGYTCKV